jgi:hypothetical protein
MTRPDQLTIKHIQDQLHARTPDWVEVNAKFARGDHWQDGAGWSGPTPPAGPGYHQVMLEIRRAFVSKNAVKEVIGRHVGGVAGREPTWSLTVRRALAEDEEPTADEQALIKEAEAVLTEWWDAREAHKLLQKAVRTLLRAERATLRLFVPDGERDEGRVPAGDLRASLFRIHADHPAPKQASVLLDERTMQRAGVYLYEADRQTYADVSYLDGDATVVRSLYGETIEEARLPLGGHLLIHELERDLLITEQVRQHQMLLNLALTMLARNVVQAGFLERIITNGLPPGRWEKDPATGKEKFIAEPMKVGAGATNYINGLPIKNEKGQVTGYTSAGVVHRDPVPVDTFRETRDIASMGILEECHQLHALISGDATASGESRRQAMADFLTDLFLTLPAVNAAGRWLLEALLALASVFAGQPGRFAGLRAEFAARIDPGPLSADELRLIIELVNAKLLSHESGMSRTGVEDVAAEQARLLAEAEAAAKLAPPPPTQNNRPPEQGSAES